MPAPRAPRVGESIETWEAWIEKTVKFLDDARESPLRRPDNFTTYRLNEFKKLGKAWQPAYPPFTNFDVRYMNVMVNNW